MLSVPESKSYIKYYNDAKQREKEAFDEARNNSNASNTVKTTPRRMYRRRR